MRRIAAILIDTSSRETQHASYDKFLFDMRRTVQPAR
jgi:hypothetical protein